MAKFAFRLQKVLDVRRAEEQRAKDAYLAAQRTREEKVSEIEAHAHHRAEVLRQSGISLPERLHLQLLMERFDDEERALRAVLAILENEESTAQREWHTRRQATEALVRLREKAFDAWRKEEERKEQAALDEWATLRRAT